MFKIRLLQKCSGFIFKVLSEIHHNMVEFSLQLELYYNGGESSNAVRDRMVETCTEIMEKEDHKVVLAVSHGGSCFNFLKAWQDPAEELKKEFPNCIIFKFEYEDKKFKLLEVIRPKA